MSDPRFLAIFSVVFILLGSYNVYIGLKRINQARARGQQIVWYKQINLLTGIEYILLSVVFLMSIGLRSGLIPSSMRVITTPFYIVVLLVTAVMAFMVIRQAFANSRRPQTRTAVRSNGPRTRNDGGSAGAMPLLLAAGALAKHDDAYQACICYSML